MCWTKNITSLVKGLILQLINLTVPGHILLENWSHDGHVTFSNKNSIPGQFRPQFAKNIRNNKTKLPLCVTSGLKMTLTPPLSQDQFCNYPYLTVLQLT